jgi:hypothetical protein
MAETTVRKVYADIEALRETWTFAAPIAGNIIVEQAGRAGVTLAGTPGQTKSITLGGQTLSGIPLGDNGQSALASTVMTTGTFEGPIVGASAATAQHTDVYIEADGDLTLEATGNVLVGLINLPDGYVVRGTVLPFKIGA